MNNLVGISIGPIRLNKETIEQRIEIARKTGTKAIEISFFRNYEINQTISQDSIDYLASLKYVSIHAPMFFGDSLLPYFNFDMKNLKRWYYDANSKAILFHPNQKIPASEQGMLFCVENMPPIPGKDFDLIKKLAEYKLEEHPEYKLVLDACHTLHYPGYLEEVVEKYRGRIQHIHLSDRRLAEKDGKTKTRDHRTFRECPDKEKFSCLKELDCPVIAEISLRYSTPKECEDILKREIESVREFFS